MCRQRENEIIMSTRAIPKNPSVAALIPIMAVVLIAFLIIGLALPVLPLHVHQDLGFGAFIVGLVTGSQFGASLLSRVSAGHYADRRGPKRAVIIGLVTAIGAGLLYGLSVTCRIGWAAPEWRWSVC
jgi:MFS family permease